MAIQVRFAVVSLAWLLCAVSVRAEIRPVRDVQKALVDQGFDAGTPDGIWGSKSVAALKGFQRAHGLAPSGVVTEDSLKALFPRPNGDVQPVAMPENVVTAPIVPSVDPTPSVISSEPARLSPPAPLPAPVTSAANGSSNKSADHSGFLVVVGIGIVAFLFFRRKSRRETSQQVRSEARARSASR